MAPVPQWLDMKRPAKRPVGRPGAGLRPGENVSDYERFTLRLPSDVRAELSAAAGVLGVPAWRVVVDAIRAYVGSGTDLTDKQKSVIRTVIRLQRDVTPE